MFGKNAGKTVQTIAKVMVWLWMAAGFIIGIVANSSSFMMVERMSALEGLGRAITALLGVCLGGAVGFAIGWFSSVLLYAFGDLVSSTHAISEDLDFLCRVKENEIAREKAGHGKKGQHDASARGWGQPHVQVRPPVHSMVSQSPRPAYVMQPDMKRQDEQLESKVSEDPEAPPF